MMFLPKVSIVIPVYNGADYMRQAIDSALSQTYSNIEIVVVNDGSSDDGATERIALSYGNKVRYFPKENGGVASALNFGINEMTGDYFSWLSHDDLYHPEKVDSQVHALSGISHQRTVLYSDYTVFSDGSEAATEVKLTGVLPEHFRFFITIKSVLHGCTLLIPRVAFDECGMFNETLRTTQDYDLWFRMAEKYEFVHLPQVLIKARQHAGQGTVKMHGIAQAEINDLLVKFVDQLREWEVVSATNESASLSYATIYRSMLQRGFPIPARHAKRLAIKSMNKGSIRNGVRTVFALLFACAVCSQFGRFRASFVWSQVIRPLRNKFLDYRVRHNGTITHIG